MSLNEFLKEQKMQDLKATVAEPQKRIEALTAGLHKVSAQLEASKPAPQVVNNPKAAAFHNQPSRFTARGGFLLRLVKALEWPLCSWVRSRCPFHGLDCEAGRVVAATEINKAFL